jgi:hypothetical protein
MERKKIIDELTAGIVEMVYTDEYSVEHIISVTLSENHLNIDDISPEQNNKNILTMWNLNEEKWQDIPVHLIVHIERLTGIGIKDDEDLINFEEIDFFLPKS